MNASHFWLSRVEAYLAHRRRFGYTLTIDETVLKGFARFGYFCPSPRKGKS